ncbi:MAG: hypothetical protein AAGI51_08690 [Pseudomonadota bacterium]
MARQCFQLDEVAEKPRQGEVLQGRGVSAVEAVRQIVVAEVT